MEQGGFKGDLKGVGNVGAGAGHGKGGTGALDKTKMEGKERIWRDELTKVDGADSSVDKGRSQGIDGDGGFGVGGFGSNMCNLIDNILDRRDMFTSFSVDSHCIPHRAPLTYQLLKVTQSQLKLTHKLEKLDF